MNLDNLEIANKVTNFINKDNSVEPLHWVLPNRKEFGNWINETFLKYRADGKMHPISNKFTPFKYQKLLRDYMQNNSPYRGILLYHGLGSGKCLKINTPLIMSDGSVKMVQDINVGDLLMGDDSTPRTVTSLARGIDKMYDIISDNGDKYTANQEHILCLKAFGYPKKSIKSKIIIEWIENNIFLSKIFIDMEEADIFLRNIQNNTNTNKNIIEIPIKDYLKLSTKTKKCLKGYRVAVDFTEKKLDIEPYLFGYSIGSNDGFIPLNYKCNSEENRLKLLAGIIDSQDFSACSLNYYKKYLLKSPYSYFFEINEPRIITNDIIYLARSLGFLIKKIKMGKHNLIYFDNPLQKNIPLKKGLKDYICTERIVKLSSSDLLTNNIKVEYVNEDDYYGFTLDGNCRFLLGDFTVTHNTCSAIEISENLKTERNIVVMLPASLRTNFIVDGLMFCGASKYKNNPEAYKEKYSFISYNANNTTSQIKKIGSLDNKVIIIEEVHNLISKMVNGILGVSKQGLEIYNFLMNAQNAKIIALSGTPIINDSFEAAVIFNILRGYIEITYFRIVKVPNIYGEEWQLGSLEEDLMSNNLIDYLEINKINKSIEFHIKINSYSDKYREVLHFIEQTCSNIGLIVKFLEVKKISLFPIEDDGEIFRNYFVKEDNEKGDTLKNENIFKRRILGLVSYYKSINENYPKVIHNDYYRVEMSNYQFQIYEILRAKERLTEKGSSSKKKKSKAVKSTFRVFSRQSSNFVFPEEIHRPYPDPTFIVSTLKTENNKNDKISHLNKLLELEEKANNEGKLSIEYKNRIDVALQKLTDNGILYFTPGPDGLDKLSPKMKVMLENIQKSRGLVFVYSNFRSLEGIEIFSRVLNFNGYSKYGTNDDKEKYAIYSGSEDEKEKKELLKVFTSNENKHGKYIKIILTTSSGAEGLDLKNIRQIHIMEPYWNQMRIEQVIGRGVRRNSHISLPANERNVEIFRYFTIYPKKNNILAKDKLTTDEHIENLSLKKQKIINELLQILKECSFDCLLNAPDIKGEYDCFNFGKDARGFSYYPNISKDIIESYVVQNKKIVKKTLAKAIWFDGKIYLHEIKNKKNIFYLYNDLTKTSVTIDPKKSKIFFVDRELHEVFDVKSTESGNPIKVGFIDSDSKLKKKK